MGWCYLCIIDDEYYVFVDEFIQVVKQCWLDILLQFEDFVQKNVMLLLMCYCDEICFFNDDIQGIVVVIVGMLIVVSCVVGSQFSEQKIVFFGVGFVGCGIVE